MACQRPPKPPIWAGGARLYRQGPPGDAAFEGEGDSRDNSARENVQESLDALGDVATFDVEVPTASTRREWEYLKVAVKRLTSWYLRYLAGQLNAFGGQVQRLGEALAARTDGLETAADELAARMELAEERLGRLEAMSNARTPRAKRGPSKDAAVEN